jgi:hypothetical protein
MKRPWFAQMVMRFRPESSGSTHPGHLPFQNDGQFQQPSQIISLKAPVWTVLSILCALAIGQLH